MLIIVFLSIGLITRLYSTYFCVWNQVQFAAGRDLRPGQLDNMIATLSNWYVVFHFLLDQELLD